MVTLRRGSKSRGHGARLYWAEEKEKAKNKREKRKKGWKRGFEKGRRREAKLEAADTCGHENLKEHSSI